jgi:hypothetical protein
LTQVNRLDRLDYITAELSALRKRVDVLERKARETRPTPTEEDYLYTGVD